MRIPRKLKKKLRVILICHTNNHECRKMKINKLKWLELKSQYKTWLTIFNRQDIKTINK